MHTNTIPEKIIIINHVFLQASNEEECCKKCRRVEKKIIKKKKKKIKTSAVPIILDSLILIKLLITGNYACMSLYSMLYKGASMWNVSGGSEKSRFKCKNT